MGQRACQGVLHSLNVFYHLFSHQALSTKKLCQPLGCQCAPYNDQPWYVNDKTQDYLWVCPKYGHGKGLHPTMVNRAELTLK